jgi:hypothetical protein
VTSGRDDLPSRHIEGLPAPLSELPWSADFVMQAIEVLPVAARDGRIVSFSPQHADSFVVGWPAGAQPEVVAAGALETLGIKPLVLHSTSWRHAAGEVVLTYLAVVESAGPVPESWVVEPVVHTDLARGDATAPPPVIGVGQVLEHALRHLAWLVREDELIAKSLPGWQALLESYVPEPFRAFGGPV